MTPKCEVRWTELLVGKHIILCADTISPYGTTEEPKAQSQDITGALVGTGLKFLVGVFGVAHFEHFEAYTVLTSCPWFSQAHVGGLDAFCSECCCPVAT